jgi:hypothetical protein
MGLLTTSGIFIVVALLVLIASISSFNFNFGKKLILFLSEVLVSLGIPVIICLSFKSSFPEFYEHGFLTGIGMILVAFIMGLLNIALFSSLLNSYFKKYISKNKNDYYYLKITFLMIFIIIALQIGFTFLVENPFKEPSSFGF